MKPTMLHQQNEAYELTKMVFYVTLVSTIMIFLNLYLG